jgi:hypothetical protein
MKSNRMIWVVATLVVSATMAITFGTRDSRSQEKNQGQVQSTPENNGYKDRSRFAVVDYDEPLPTDVKECQKRKLANGRYDGMGWVFKKPYPDDSGSGLEDEKDPPSLVPVTESDFIVVGQITESHAHLSNDKLGVYTEFSIQVKRILKEDAAKKIVLDESITADREGGYVRYPNGQKIFYENSNRSLPQLGKEYVFFLTSDKQSPSYNILTLYELKESGITRLDYVQNIDDFKDRYKNATKATFIEAIRNKSLQLSQPPK